MISNNGNKRTESMTACHGRCKLTFSMIFSCPGSLKHARRVGAVLLKCRKSICTHQYKPFPYDEREKLKKKMAFLTNQKAKIK